MIKKLPEPFVFNGKTFVSFEPQKPVNKVIAQTRARAQEDDSFGAQAVLAAGSVGRLIDDADKEVEDRKQIELAMNASPFANISYIMVQGLLVSGVDDVIEGVYPCPRCKTVQYSADPDNANPDDDDADRIRKLKVVCSPKVRTIKYDLEDPVVIESEEGEAVQTVNSVTLRPPTTEDLVRASRRVGIKNATTLNAVAYSLATIEVNGSAVDRKWQGEWGQMVYERMTKSDMIAIQKEVRKYGLKTTVKRICHQCGKEWDAEVDTGSFFASGLEE